MKKYLLVISLLAVGISKSAGQITPPGLDGSRAVGWIAIGFSQAIGTRWSVATYAGTSTQSNLANYTLWQNPAISVVNQEWGYQFAKHWQLVLAGSLRTQALYDEVPPYESSDPAHRLEARAYARLFFRHQAGKLSWAHSFRPEYRRFFNPDWHAWPNPYQIRLRLKSQISYPLNATNTTQFIAANDVLTVINRVRNPVAQSLSWGPYQLSEDRLSTFIRRTLKNRRFTLMVALCTSSGGMLRRRKFGIRPIYRWILYSEIRLRNGRSDQNCWTSPISLMNTEHNLLIQTIRHWINVQAEEETIIAGLFDHRRLAANDFFLQTDNVCHHVGYVVQGLLRYYTLDDGVEHTYDFSPEQTFTCNYESFLTQTPSSRFIQAVEDTTLLVISYGNLQQLYNQLREGQKFGRLVAESLFVGMLQKLSSFYTETADERYDSFLKTYPHLQERLPQYVIASYVGIKPQSLSRLRAQRAGKQY